MQEEEKLVIKAEDVEKNKSWSIDDDHIRNMGEYIMKSMSGRSLYYLMRFLLFIESVTWTVMDSVKAKRMNVAARINKNYQNYK